MKTLNCSEMREIQGGAISATLGLFIAGALAFVVGVIDGIFRPLVCRK